MQKLAAILTTGIVLSACQDHDTIGSHPIDEHLRAEISDDISPDTAAEWIFNCQNGQRLIVTFDHPRQMATVRRFDGLAFDLTRKGTSDGYLYAATGVALSGSGKTAKWRSPNIEDTVCEVSEIKSLDS